MSHHSHTRTSLLYIPYLAVFQAGGGGAGEGGGDHSHWFLAKVYCHTGNIQV
jgi:hypothetical protein